MIRYTTVWTGNWIHLTNGRVAEFYGQDSAKLIRSGYLDLLNFMPGPGESPVEMDQKTCAEN